MSDPWSGLPVGSSSPTLPDPIPSAPLLIAVPVWRLLIAGSGFTGYALAAAAFDAPGEGLSQLASLTVGAAYVFLAAVAVVRPTSEWAWLRGALATLMVLVGGAFMILLSGSLSQGWSIVEHVLTPLLVVIDYLAFTGGPFRLWHPLSWLALPLGYLVYYVHEDLLLYDFLDPARSGYVPTVVGFLASIITIGYLLMVLAQARVNLVSARR